MDWTSAMNLWRDRREEWARLGITVDGGEICQEILGQLDQIRAFEEAAEVDIEEASRYSGYSAGHLSKLVRQKKLPETRRGGKLVFRTVDLPRKPARVAVGDPAGYDAIADARQVAAQRNGRQ